VHRNPPPRTVVEDDVRDIDNVRRRVMNIEKIYLDVGRNFGASRGQVLLTIALPGALPFILTGMRLAWGIALLLIVSAELINSRSGLGYLIFNSWQTFSIDEMYAGLLTISALGLVSFALLDWIEQKLIPWKPEAT
jgi:NitT/TauT family transport system permease protein